MRFIVVLISFFLISITYASQEQIDGMENFKGVPHLESQVTKIEGYEVGKTTEAQFVSDGWNSNDPYEGRLGIMGVGCNLLSKANLDGSPPSGLRSECEVLLGYAPCEVEDSRFDSTMRRRIDEYIESAKNQKFDYSGMLYFPIFLKAGATRAQVDQDKTLMRLRSMGIATSAKACSENSNAGNNDEGVLVPNHYIVLHFRNGTLENKDVIRVP